MATLKERLEAAGYDTSSVDESAILKKLDAAGYDTSSLGQSAAPTQAPEPTMNPSGLMDNLKMAGRAFLGGSQQDPTNQVAQEGANKTGEDIATSKFGQANPNVAAGIGTAVSMAPDIAALAGSGMAQEAAKAGELGQVGRIISGPARSEAGAAIGAAQKAAGLDNEIVPSLKRMTQNLDLPKGQATVKDYITALTKAVNEGKLSAQELLDHHKLLTDLLKDEPTGLSKMLSQRPSRLGGSGVAQAAKTDSNIVQQLNEAAPGRKESAANYAAAVVRQKFYKAAGGVGLAAIGGGKLSALLDKVLGR